MQITMDPHHIRQPFPIKIYNFFTSKTSLSHLFILLLCFPVGFICSFYLQTFPTVVHTSIISVFHSLSPWSKPVPPPLPASLPSPADTDTGNLSLSVSASSPPAPLFLPDTDSDNLSVSTSSPSLLSPSPTPASLSLPDTDSDNLSISTSSPQLLSPSPTPASLSLPDADSDNLSASTSSPPPEPVLSPSPTPSISLLPTSMQIPKMHNMSDDDLVKSVMEVSTLNVNVNGPYKVAFMFLTPGPLPLSGLWELFFKGHEGLFSIYVHTHPSYNQTIPQDSVFYDTRITSQPVYWGDISMIEAERRLLANALLDPSNQRFVLLSDSCIPLFNFTTTYNYLINSNLSYLNSFDDKGRAGRGRYNPQMFPNITIQDWRKGSQWFEVNRDLARNIVADQKYYHLFKEYCHPPCYNDEHYLPTMVNVLYGMLNSNRTITYVDWSRRGSPHPRRFTGNEVTEELLNSIRFGSTGCVYNDNTTPMCVLFARKFAPDTLNQLVMFAPFLVGASR